MGPSESSTQKIGSPWVDLSDLRVERSSQRGEEPEERHPSPVDLGRDVLARTRRVPIRGREDDELGAAVVRVGSSATASAVDCFAVPARHPGLTG